MVLKAGLRGELPVRRWEVSPWAEQSEPPPWSREVHGLTQRIQGDVAWRKGTEPSGRGAAWWELECGLCSEGHQEATGVGAQQ